MTDVRIKWKFTIIYIFLYFPFFPHKGIHNELFPYNLKYSLKTLSLIQVNFIFSLFVFLFHFSTCSSSNINSGIMLLFTNPPYFIIFLILSLLDFFVSRETRGISTESQAYHAYDFRFTWFFM